MGADGRIAGIDPCSTTWVRAANQHDHAGTVMVVSALDRTSHAVVELDQRGAWLFLQQVIEATGVDLVGAAREVEAARIALHSADTEDELRDAMAARSRAMGALSAELAKLDGGT